MAQKKILYSLDFVNEGKNFSISNWTVEKHEDALAEMTKTEPDKTPEEYDALYRYYVILQSLREVDEEVSISDIKGMHPEDLILLFNAVYSAGKKGILATNFREGKSPSKKQSTIKTN